MMPAILEPQPPESIDYLRGGRERRRAFRLSIAEQAARLKEKKCGAHQPRDAAPEAVAAQTDPPAINLPLPMWMAFFALLEKCAERTGPLSIREIQLVVCRHTGFSLNDMLSPRRSGQLARARQIAMYLAKELTKRSLPEIGRRFGGRDHTTALHAFRKIKSMAVFNAEHPEMFNAELAEDVRKIRAELEARL